MNVAFFSTKKYDRASFTAADDGRHLGVRIEQGEGFGLLFALADVDGM